MSLASTSVLCVQAQPARLLRTCPRLLATLPSAWRAQQWPPRADHALHALKKLAVILRGVILLKVKLAAPAGQGAVLLEPTARAKRPSLVHMRGVVIPALCHPSKHRRPVAGPCGAGMYHQSAMFCGAGMYHQSAMLGPCGAGMYHQSAMFCGAGMYHQSAMLGPCGTGMYHQSAMFYHPPGPMQQSMACRSGGAKCSSAGASSLLCV